MPFLRIASVVRSQFRLVCGFFALAQLTATHSSNGNRAICILHRYITSFFHALRWLGIPPNELLTSKLLIWYKDFHGFHSNYVPHCHCSHFLECAPYPRHAELPTARWSSHLPSLSPFLLGRTHTSWQPSPWSPTQSPLSYMKSFLVLKTLPAHSCCALQFLCNVTQSALCYPDCLPPTVPVCLHIAL